MPRAAYRSLCAKPKPSISSPLPPAVDEIPAIIHLEFEVEKPLPSFPVHLSWFQILGFSPSGSGL
ncbi:hypothetical protein DsansV1_C19g0162131 [Dioscorea sansibarensis]